MGNIMYRSLHLYKLYVSNGNHKSINHGKSILFFWSCFLYIVVILQASVRSEAKFEFFPTDVVVTLIQVVNGTKHRSR